MCSSRTSCSDQHKVSRIVTALYRYPSNAIDHVVVDDGVHTMGRTLHRHAKGLGNLANR